MSKEKQIEAMAREIYENTDISIVEIAENIAEHLYNAGYRKQSEWISVEDRKPSESGKYLVCTKRGNVYQTKFYSYPENKGGHWGQKDKGRNITHWMPLPEAPKMKGGEE